MRNKLLNTVVIPSKNSNAIKIQKTLKPTCKSNTYKQNFKNFDSSKLKEGFYETDWVKFFVKMTII